MGQPAAKQGDQVVAVDTHLIQPPGPTSPVPVPHPFNGIIDGSLSSDVNIESRPRKRERLSKWPRQDGQGYVP